MVRQIYHIPATVATGCQPIRIFGSKCKNFGEFCFGKEDRDASDRKESLTSYAECLEGNFIKIANRVFELPDA